MSQDYDDQFKGLGSQVISQNKCNVLDISYNTYHDNFMAICLRDLISYGDTNHDTTLWLSVKEISYFGDTQQITL